jgi:hypothetical protein
MLISIAGCDPERSLPSFDVGPQYERYDHSSFMEPPSQDNTAIAEFGTGGVRGLM